MLPPLVSSLFAATTLLALSSAQNSSSCNTTSSLFPDGLYNATGHVTVPGPRVNESYAESSWTWARYMRSIYDAATNTTSIVQTIGLQTSPVQNLSDPSLPYTACVFALTDLNMHKNDIASENGTCSTSITAACRSHLLSVAQGYASSISRTVQANKLISCPSLLDSSGIITASPSPCEGQWSEAISTQFLPNNFTSRPSDGCPPTNPGQSNATNQAFFSWGSTSGTVGNYTFYDQAVLNALPILTVAWLKDDGVDGTGQQWADVELMCVGANSTVGESRSLATVQKANGVGRLGTGWVVLAAGVVTLGVGLVL